MFASANVPFSRPTSTWLNPLWGLLCGSCTTYETKKGMISEAKMAARKAFRRSGCVAKICSRTTSMSATDKTFEDDWRLAVRSEAPIALMTNAPEKASNTLALHEIGTSRPARHWTKSHTTADTKKTAPTSVVGANDEPALKLSSDARTTNSASSIHQKRRTARSASATPPATPSVTTVAELPKPGPNATTVASTATRTIASTSTKRGSVGCGFAAPVGSAPRSAMTARDTNAMIS